MRAVPVWALTPFSHCEVQPEQPWSTGILLWYSYDLFIYDWLLHLPQGHVLTISSDTSTNSSSTLATISGPQRCSIDTEPHHHMPLPTPCPWINLFTASLWGYQMSTQGLPKVRIDTWNVCGAAINKDFFFLLNLTYTTSRCTKKLALGHPSYTSLPDHLSTHKEKEERQALPTHRNSGALPPGGVFWVQSQE